VIVFIFQHTPRTQFYALSLHDALPILLTRAGYAGLQRYTAKWTGDNRSEDNHMLLGIRLLNSLGVSGVAFTGMDIGGFTGNPSRSEEHTSELQSRENLVCRLLLEKKKR